MLRPVSLVLLTVSLPASALGLYDDNINHLALGGHAGLSIVQQGGDTAVVDSSSRMRFHFTRQLSQGWQTEALMEWGFNLVDSGTDLLLNGDALQSQREGQFLFNRLGFLALQHDGWGRLSIGKQWSVYYDIAAFTDEFITTGGLASGTYNFGTDGGLSGTGRADSAIQYRYDINNFHLGLQYQASAEGTVGFIPPEECEEESPPEFCQQLEDFEISHDDSWGASVRYEFAGFTFGVGYNRGDFKSANLGSARDEAIIYGIRYGRIFQPGLYVGANYADTENHELDNQNRVFNGDGYELMVNWTFENGLTIVSGLNWLESDDPEYEAANGTFKRALYILGAHYRWGPLTKFYIEGKLDDSEFGVEQGSDDDVIGLGARFYF
ncbi:porin [Ferrimonas marina]|uniref:Outer membrane protein (Porin) n=1 Tax=Ferrimonas marina TaxID=299255 RepID=A0A1M5RP87_9GAMM|nr:porin [Ferrimonas marina]SHH27950.1 Outer membrane protein (porin) [Ferrimonas marina]